jgi:uncharacterized protein
MKIAVASLGERPVQLHDTERPEELSLSADSVEFTAPVDVSTKVTRMQDDVLAQGSARTRARVQCSRCLSDVELELAGEFEALYVPETGAYGARAGRRDFEWGDQRVNFYSELTVDLTDEIRQCLLLELPMKPLCRPDCAGLCTRCGENLNDGPCGCAPDEPDDTWAPLRDLLPPNDQ